MPNIIRAATKEEEPDHIKQKNLLEIDLCLSSDEECEEEKPVPKTQPRILNM